MIHGAVLISAFVIFWFLALLVALPIGLHGEADKVTGAPPRPRLLLKAGYATAAAMVLWGIFYALIVMHVVDI
jgi:predicted secreted protein